MYQHRRDRLLSLIRDKFSGLRKTLADRSGWSEARISQILSTTYREGRAFSEKIARKLEDDLALPPMYFDHGAVAPSQTATTTPEQSNTALSVRPVTVESAGVVAIRKVNLRLSAGIMGFVVEPDYETTASFNVDQEWLDKNGFDPTKLIALEVKGESMQPRLYGGDLVVANTADTKPVDGEVFAVNYEGEAVIKRLARDAGKWWLTSDNPDQQRFPRKLCDGSFGMIIGRVVLKKSEII